MQNNELASLIFSLVMLTYIGFAVFNNPRTTFLKKAKHLLSWLVIFFALVTVYVFRGNFTSVKEKYLLEITPGYQKREGDIITLKMADDGHFYINLIVNQQPLRFLIDTGASEIVLNLSDAKKLALSSLVFSYKSYTANGVVKTAKTYANIQLDDLLFENITVYVNSGDLGVSLLGMSFLNRLDSFEFDGQYLRLKLPNP